MALEVGKMRITLTFLASLLVACTLGIARQQNSDDPCGFVLAGELSHPTVKGPNDLVPLVYVVEQPDSPVGVISVDLEGMWLSISNERHTEQGCTKYTIRNRSNRTVQKFSVTLRIATIGGATGGALTTSSSSLAPERTVEITNSCGVKGRGFAKDNYVRLLVYVDSIDLGDCFYRPSLRVPRSLRTNASW